MAPLVRRSRAARREAVSAIPRPQGEGGGMTGFTSWDEVKRRAEQARREAHPDVDEAEWATRKEAARLVQEAHLLGHHLRQLRRERGLTQQQAAAQLGITQARVSQLEQGKAVDLAAMRAYAQALGARLTLVLEVDDQQIRIA
ncbi:XRE family transcriptional regulator [Streptomyces botrytidirepellens]|uniref:XRE family transcriptional regulator n=2 Tax=Streptomyces botrytidirepellens TaxID=2486417 RepID=A0A3M8SZ25_9ACTN|nr:XRE family transcriptional regulator [Streptomyces botrytidirepellens]